MNQTCVRRTAPRTLAFASRRRALTLPEVLVVAGVTLLLLALVAVVVTRPPRRSIVSRRTACAANLSSMGKGLYTYAVENSDMFPIAAHMPAEADEVGRVKYAPGMIGTHRGVAGDPNSGETTEADTEMSTTRNLWVLVRTGGTSPRSFICPSTEDRASFEDNPADFRDFRSWEEVSYGYQVPYGKHGRPSSMCDQRMPLAADKGPYGAALESGAKNPGVPTLRFDASPDDWMPWNSPNHGGEGQVVLFADSHVEFLAKPIVGVNNDNIYTRWSTADGGGTASDLPRIQGTPPTGIETPWSDTDSLIYP
ncbi:MAG: hypothetical protein GX616_18325 [Planctomycetes bacterium]|nr:hypothetical protein [Planctomycetota bacterium]